MLPGNAAGSFAAGVGAQLCGSVAWVPMDVVKERLQVQGPRCRADSRPRNGPPQFDVLNGSKLPLDS